MNLSTYINLYQLLEKQHTNHEQHRVFGLKHKEASRISQLLSWIDTYQGNLSQPLYSEQLSRYLYGISLVLGIIAFLLGLFSGIGLLQYNGHEPVNMVYFLAMAVLLPLITMLLSLLSMLRANATRSTLIHLSPAFWMERIIRLLPYSTQKGLEEIPINPLLLNWLVIKRAQALSLLFSFGLLVALLGMVATQDIAFAWSTTLQVDTGEFHQFLSTLALPWRTWIPSAVPSLTLIEQSQYFRLGEQLDSNMVAHAAQLGEWWKFLAMATLFYAIVLRFGMWLLASFGMKRALKSALLRLEGVDRLLYEMNTPLVMTTSSDNEQPFMQGEYLYSRVMPCIASTYPVILGWAMRLEDIGLINDSLGFRGNKIYDVGGTNSLAEDSQIITQCTGEVLLYVKAWEPPTMDWVDFLTELTLRSERVIVQPIGMATEAYQAETKAIEIWMRRLQQIDNPKVWLCQNS